MFIEFLLKNVFLRNLVVENKENEDAFKCAESPSDFNKADPGCDLGSALREGAA